MARPSVTRVDLDPPKVINHKVANEEGVKLAIQAEAERVGLAAKAVLAAHRYDGNAEIKVEHHMLNEDYGHIDSFVVLQDDPHIGRDGKPDEGNAKAIEFGRRHNFTGKFIPGIHPLYKGAGLA